MNRNIEKQVKIIISLIFFILVCLLLNAEAKDNPQEQKILVLENELKINTESLEAVRRDQLNYKIEKDLLKEAYSSNLQTINLIIALILGSLTILGYLGVRSIDSIKKDFKGELDKLILLRGQFEHRMKEVDDQLLNSKKRFEELALVNEEQDKRLQILEIQEKSESFIKQKNYPRALEYITIGLGLADNDLTLLEMKAYCLMKLKRIPEATIVYENSLSHDPNNLIFITNLIELYMLTGKRENALHLMQTHSARLLEQYGQYSNWYLSALEHFMYGSETELKEFLARQPVETPELQAQRIKVWDYSEALSVINSMSTKPGYKAIISAISFLDGKISLADLNKEIS